MLFWIFVAILIVGIVYIGLYFKTNAGEWLWTASVSVTLIGLACVAVSCMCLASSYITADSQVASNQARYESLTYQYENDFYTNDNDIGKKELMNEIREWNEDLAKYKELQRNFWVGIYYPNVFDQFEFIEYK